MFGPLGGPELLLVFVIALIVFGPRKLPEIGKSLGKMISEFRRASNDLKRTIEDEVEAERLRELTTGYATGSTTGPLVTSPTPEASVPPTEAAAETATTESDSSPDSATGAAPAGSPPRAEPPRPEDPVLPAADQS